MDLKSLIFFTCFLASNGYKRYQLQNNSLCPQRSTTMKLISAIRQYPKVKLGEDENSAAIIEQVWNNDTLNLVHSKCIFDVLPTILPNRRPNNSGLYTVIRKMKLRKDNVTGTCYDYVQFKLGNRNPTDKLCGDYKIDNLQTDRMYFDKRNGELQVIVHIDKKRPIKDQLELSLVITAHYECSLNSGFLCYPNDSSSCISRLFENDGIKNCMPPLCRDEGGCFSETITTELVDTSSIALSALTSLIFTMVAVSACFWLCWKYRECYNSGQNSSRRRSQDAESPNIALPTIPATSANGETPTSPIDPSKDLPPSYESLFPDR